MPFADECYQWPSLMHLPEFIIISSFCLLIYGYSSLPALDRKVQKGMLLDCLVHDCSMIGCMRVSIVFGGLVGKCGGRAFSQSRAFGSQAVL